MSALFEINTPSDALEHETFAANRTILFGITQNNTPFPIQRAFGQITSTVSGSGWIDNTGVFGFCGTGSIKECLFDPLQKGWRILGQGGSISIMINGQQLDSAYPQLTGDKYWEEMTFRIGQKPGGRFGELYLKPAHVSENSIAREKEEAPA